MKEQRWSVSRKERQQQGNDRSREKGKTELRLSVEVLQRTRTLGKEKCRFCLAMNTDTEEDWSSQKAKGDKFRASK